MSKSPVRYLPGLLLLVLGGLLGRAIADIVPYMNYILLATLVGLIVANTAGLPERARPGVGLYSICLETGIVLMGAQVMFGEVFATGGSVVLLLVVFLGFSLLLVETLSVRLFGTSEKLGSLLAAGSSICGVSAIVAVSGIIDPDEDQVAYAIATILLFDVVTLFTYPLAGRLLALPDIVFGVWAGISMFSTGPVVAAGYEYSSTAGKWAVLTKLTRNTFLGIVATVYAVHYAKRGQTKGVNGWGVIWNGFPKFVIGFILFVVIANVGLLTKGQMQSLENASNWLFLLAFVGLGLNIDLANLRNTGLTPILVVFVSLVTVSTLSLLGAMLLL